MNKHLFVILFVFSAQLSYGQKFSFVLRNNFGIGASYQSLGFQNSNLSYSPGGGAGIDVGLQFELMKNLALQSTLGYQQHLAYKSETVNGVTNKSSVTFNRTSINLGLHKKFQLKEGIMNGFLLGAGLNYNFPGLLKITENDTNFGAIEYNPNTGFYVELGFVFKFTENFSLIPSLRYRNVGFSATSYTQGRVSDLPAYLRDLNGNGVELGVTIIKRLKSKADK